MNSFVKSFKNLVAFKSISIILVLSFGLVPSLCFAQAVACPQVESQQVQLAEKAKSLYKWAFGNGYYYSYGYCSHNTWRFLNLLESCGLDISKAQVLFISRTDSQFITLENERKSQAPPMDFGFHVVLEVEGKIFDSSFGDTAETPDSIDYLSRQFTMHKTKNWSSLKVFSYNAKEYADLFNPGFNGHYTYVDWLNPSGDQILAPYLTIDGWLMSQKPNASLKK